MPTTLTQLPPTSWETRAACRQNPDLWASGFTHQRALAIHVCVTHCPVYRQCGAGVAVRPCPGTVQAGVLYNDAIRPAPAKRQPSASGRTVVPPGRTSGTSNGGRRRARRVARPNGSRRSGAAPTRRWRTRGQIQPRRRRSTPAAVAGSATGHPTPSTSRGSRSSPNWPGSSGPTGTSPNTSNSPNGRSGTCAAPTTSPQACPTGGHRARRTAHRRWPRSAAPASRSSPSWPLPVPLTAKSAWSSDGVRRTCGGHDAPTTSPPGWDAVTRGRAGQRTGRRSGRPSGRRHDRPPRLPHAPRRPDAAVAGRQADPLPAAHRRPVPRTHRRTPAGEACAGGGGESPVRGMPAEQRLPRLGDRHRAERYLGRAHAGGAGGGGPAAGAGGPGPGGAPRRRGARCGLNPAEFEVVGGGRRQHVCEGCLPAAQREAGTPRSTVRIKVEAASADDGQLDLFDLGGGAA
jgi:hypothetical protein